MADSSPPLPKLVSRNARSTAVTQVPLDPVGPTVVFTQPTGERLHTQPMSASLKHLGGSQKPFVKLDWLKRKGEKTQAIKEILRTISVFAYKHDEIIANFHMFIVILPVGRN